MALSLSRIELRGRSEYPWEQEAIEFAIAELPNSDPYRVWCLVDFIDATTGRLYEIDLVVLGYSAIYLVEIKSGPGLYTGDAVDWWREHEGRKFYMDPPLSATNHKAKVLKSRLRPLLEDRKSAPWIEPLVFLSSPDARLGLSRDGLTGVVRRDNFANAIVRHEFPGTNPGDRRKPISRPVAADIARALARLGFREREGKARVGGYKLDELRAEGPGYQDWDAVHADRPQLRRRARIYLVPSQTSIEDRQRLRRAADREATLLHDVKDHPNVLRATDYVTDAPLGPTVLFDDFEDSLPLSAFIRESRLSLEQKVEIISQVGRALQHCHEKGVVHGGLSPDAVLVRQAPSGGAPRAPGGAEQRSTDDKLETRLYNFQLGLGASTEGTSHWTQLASTDWLVYQAPEVIEQSSRRTVKGDIFALGALAYFVLTRQDPAVDIVAARKLLRERQCFDPLVVKDDIPGDVAEVIGRATQLSIANRADDAGLWVDDLRRAAAPREPTEDAEPASDTSPLKADVGDILVTGSGALLAVEGNLGTGATSRVLRVQTEDDRSAALKVSLTADHDDLLEAEARTLDRCDDPRIVKLIERLVIAGRPCLLLSLAGDENLHRALQFEGTISLDYASRYGDDLLGALVHLEERGILHRDIKPANIGVGSARKKAQQLTLFDFSLAEVSLDEVNVGTSIYRDPFLFDRGRADFAADRWSVAVTLHEMLTGKRPDFGEGSALDPDAELDIAAERFDSAVRDKLAAFFERALHRDVEARFGSAGQMRDAWREALAEPSEASVVPEPTEVSDADVAAIALDTPIDALPLGTRAKNALDRAGLLRAGDLLDLPDNRLSAVRGVGSKVATEILDLRDRWRATLERAPASAEPFFPDYTGPNKLLTAALAESGPEPDDLLAGGDPGDLLTVADIARELGIDPPMARRKMRARGMSAEGGRYPPVERGSDEHRAYVDLFLSRPEDATRATALIDAGITTLGQLAAAPADQIRTLAERGDLDTGELGALLQRESRASAASERPASLEGWLAALFGDRRKRTRYVAALFGLAAPFEGRLDVTSKEVAADAGVTAANIYTALSQRADEWREHPAIDDLLELVGEALVPLGGVAPLADVGARLGERLPHQPDDLAPTRLAALARIAAEVDKDSVGRGQQASTESGNNVGGLELVRIQGQPWLSVSTGHASAVRDLGAAADTLASRPVLATPGEVSRRLADVVAQTPLEDLPAERLAALAAAASQTAALSSRLEIYPRGMDARRALDLSASAITGGLTPAELRGRIAARYPEAEHLPEGGALDKLLESSFELQMIDGRYERKGTRRTPSTGFSAISTPSLHRPGRPPSPQTIERSEFEDKIRSALERRRFRILAVDARHAAAAATALRDRFDLEVVSLDRLFADGLDALAGQMGIQADDIYAIDREGPGGPDWDGFKSLARQVAGGMAEQLTRPGLAPTLLISPGLLARYELTDSLRRVVAHAKQSDDGPLFLLVPAFDRGGIPLIDGRLEIPGKEPSDGLWIPRGWIKQARLKAAG